MPKHIFIKQEGGNDHISIFDIDPFFIVTADREDLEKLHLLEEGDRPGIYILMSDKKRYVGQTSDSVSKRLKKHDLNKLWWNKVIFFGRGDGHLSKAHLDYLEAILITRFEKSNYDLDNGTLGNTSFISKMDKIDADILLSTVMGTLDDIVNIDLFDSLSSNFEDNVIDMDKQFIMFDNHKFTGNSLRKILVNIVSYSIDNYDIEKLADIMTSGKPSTAQFIGMEEKISNQGAKLTQHIADTPYYVYGNYSKDSLLKKIKILADLLNKNLSIDFI